MCSTHKSMLHTTRKSPCAAVKTQQSWKQNPRIPADQTHLREHYWVPNVWSVCVWFSGGSRESVVPSPWSATLPITEWLHGCCISGNFDPTEQSEWWKSWRRPVRKKGSMEAGEIEMRILVERLGRETGTLFFRRLLSWDDLNGQKPCRIWFTI